MTTDLTLWGRKNSANVQKAVWALAEVGKEYEHIAVGGAFKGLDTPEYRALNPNGLVPTLQDGDLIVWESQAILRYIAAEYGAEKLWRATPRERAIVDQWADWGAITFQPAWLGIFINVVRTPKSKQNPDAIAAVVKKSNDAMALLDAQLAGREFVAGDFSYADIAIGVALYRWYTMEFNRPILPNVDAWYDRLQSRPTFKSSIMVSYDDLYVR
ncbi:glutathione S-transferase family protein [Devosia rhodophyticola]|uniref:Glutathione S-transferase family protein n=1 Tax=Devosia rhodophyticola TaxID=3026423 RepID=A0ABY7YWL5_9HYPH|nr:glutathione S-transferase family protein [Devosia rhodophyticola]WDR05768.1 glutathione S-transferase family protein [Devosia rhodophyticola]